MYLSTNVFSNLKPSKNQIYPFRTKNKTEPFSIISLFITNSNLTHMDQNSKYYFWLKVTLQSSLIKDTTFIQLLIKRRLLYLKRSEQLMLYGAKLGYRII